MTSDPAVMTMIDSAAKLLEADGYIINPGVYERWAVAGTRQSQALGYMAFLLPAR